MSITIAGRKFDLISPYGEGSVITEGEASQLNQVRHENVRNNLAKTVKEWTGDEEALLAKVVEYDAAYVMGVRAGSTGETVARDPVSTEARALAKLAILASIERAGRQKPDNKALQAAITELLAHPTVGPNFRAKAEERVNKRKEEAAAALDMVTEALASTAATA